MSEEKVIHQFKKNANERVRISFSTFKGKRLLNLRVYYNAAKEGEDWRPTPKGLTLRRELIPELKEAIDKALAAWERELPGGPGDSEPVRGDG